MKYSKIKPTCYVFGYGSLMYPSGINGRGMSHEYQWKDLSPATLYGFRRGMYACYARLLYYGLLWDTRGCVEGVLVPIFSEKDFLALLDSEGASDKYKNKMYKVEDVSLCVYKNGVPMFNVHDHVDTPIHTLVSKEDKSDEGRLTPWYIADVWHGIRHWGENTMELMHKTGIVRPTRLQMRVRHVYGAIKHLKRVYHMYK